MSPLYFSSSNANVKHKVMNLTLDFHDPLCIRIELVSQELSDRFVDDTIEARSPKALTYACPRTPQ